MKIKNKWLLIIFVFAIMCFALGCSQRSQEEKRISQLTDEQFMEEVISLLKEEKKDEVIAMSKI